MTKKKKSLIALAHPHHNLNFREGFSINMLFYEKKKKKKKTFRVIDIVTRFYDHLQHYV